MKKLLGVAVITALIVGFSLNASASDDISTGDLSIMGTGTGLFDPGTLD